MRYVFSPFINSSISHIWASSDKLRFHSNQRKGQVNLPSPKAVSTHNFMNIFWMVPAHRRAWLHIWSAFLLTQRGWRSQMSQEASGSQRTASARSAWHAQWRTVDTMWHMDGPLCLKELSFPKGALTSASPGEVEINTPTSPAQPATLSATAPSSFFLGTSVQVAPYLCSARPQTGPWTQEFSFRVVLYEVQQAKWESLKQHKPIEI